ncbi:ABC transporter family substrate-binding protein [Actinophytocola sp.]|uniref:ABC transporter family substrate-binding protein n=1 Tax=Actinophytocola sp. TaxID=1872138 RepID=UPI00389AD9E6
MRRPVLALTLITVLAAAGCGGTDNAEAPPPKAALNQIDINPVDPDTLRQGGDLNWPVQDFPNQFNELQGDATSGDIPPVTRSIMPTPSWEKPDASFQPNPDYVESFTLVSENPQKVAYKLNRKAHWSDGKPITWEDYKSQWQAVNGRNPAFIPLSTAGYANISDIAKGADEYAFTVTYDPTYADWGSVFQVLYPKSATSNPDEFNKGWIAAPKVTGGPFAVDKIDKTAKTVIVKRDPNWWGYQPRLDRIIFRNLSTTGGTSSIDALANGGLDFSGIAGNLDAYKRAKQIPHVAFRRATLPNLRWIVFNGGGSGPLADKEVRKAVIRGIDVASITKAEVGQLIPDAKPLGNHIFVEGFPGYQDNSKGYGYDPEAAKKRLDELGWKLNGQYREKQGRTLTIRDVVPADNPASDDEAVLVQHQLAQIGVEVKVEQVDPDGYFDEQITPGDFELAHWAQMDAASLITVIPSFDLTQDNVEQNFGHIGSAKINKLLKDAAKELDRDKRNAILNEIDKELWDLGYARPLYRRPSIVAVKDNLANFGNSGLAAIDYTKIGWIQK